MKKSIILFFALAMLMQPAGAMTNEAIYKMCKPYVNSGFDINAKHQDLCFGFFVGIAHTTHMVCEHAKHMLEKERGDTAKMIQKFAHVHGSGGYDGKSYPVNAQILSFMNWVEKNPNQLSGVPMPVTWLQDYKCDIQLRKAL